MSLLKDTLYYNAGNYVYLGAQWIISVLLVRLGGFEDAGYFSLAMTVGNMFGLFGGYGLRSFQVSDINNRYSNSTYAVSRLFTVFASLVLCLAYSVISGYSFRIVFLIMLYMAFKASEAYSDVLTAIWQRNGNMRSVGMSLFFKGIVSLIVFFAVYSAFGSVLSATAAMAAAVILIMVLYDFRVLRKYEVQRELFRSINKTEIVSLLKQGALTMLYVVSTSVFLAVPRQVIEQKLSAEMLGIFSSVSAPTVVISVFSVGVLLPLAPKLAQMYRQCDKKGLFSVIAISCGVCVFTGAAAAGLSVLVGKQVFSLLFGEEILSYYSLFYYLILSASLIAVLNCVATVYIAFRKLKSILALSTGACAAVTVLSLVLIPRFGIYGAAYAMIIAQAAELAAQLIIISVCIFRLKKADV